GFLLPIGRILFDSLSLIIGLYVNLPLLTLLNTHISSVCFNGIIFAFKYPPPISLSQVIRYLKFSILLHISRDVKGSSANNTTTPFGFMIRAYSAHNGSNGITVSHLHAVVPYGKSASIISTEPSAIRFISSIVSPCIIVLIISLLISLNIKRPIHIYCRLQSADSPHILNEKRAGKCPLLITYY